MEAKHLEIPKEYFENKPERIIGDALLFNNTTEIFLKENGLFAIVEGAEFLRKGTTTTHATYANNLIKEFIKQALKNPIVFLFKNKAIQSFNNFCARCFLPYKADKKYLCKTAYQVCLFTELFLKEIDVKQWQETAKNVAQIFEYDDRYRYTLQDLMTELDHKALKNNPKKEILRLLEIYKQREIQYVAEKNTKLIKLTLLLLYIPKYKKAFIKASIYLKGMQYDESDWYWTCTKNDYKYGGLTQEERAKGRKLPSLYTVKNNVVVKISG